MLVWLYVLLCFPWFNMYGTLCAFCTCLTISFPILRKFLAIISSKFFSYFFFYSSGTQKMQKLVHLILSQRSLRLSWIFCILFHLFCYSYVLLLMSSFMSVNICIMYLGWPMRKKWQPTPVFLPETSHGHRSLTGYSPISHKKLEMTEWLSTLGEYILKIVTSSSWIDPLCWSQCSFLSLVTVFVLVYILCDKSVATPTFFNLHLHGVFFPSLYFVSLLIDLQWFSCRQHI